MYEYVYYRCDALQVYGVCYRHVFVIDACYTSVVFVTGVCYRCMLSVNWCVICIAGVCML